MGEFRESTGGVETMSAEQLDGIALNYAGVVGGYGYGYSLPRNASNLAGGWATKVVNKQGMGNHGKIILVGTDRRTKHLLFKGQVALFQGMGYDSKQANALASKYIRCKQLLAPRVLEMIKKDCDWVKVMLTHPLECGAGIHGCLYQFARAVGVELNPDETYNNNESMALIVGCYKGIALKPWREDFLAFAHRCGVPRDVAEKLKPECDSGGPEALYAAAAMIHLAGGVDNAHHYAVEVKSRGNFHGAAMNEAITAMGLMDQFKV